MLIWDWFFHKSRDQISARSRRRLSVEPLEARTNLTCIVAPADLDAVDVPCEDAAVVAPAHDTDSRSIQVAKVRSALATTETVVEGFQSLLFDLQKEVAPLSKLAPLEPDNLLNATESELDRAIDQLATSSTSADDATDPRAHVRELQNALEDIRAMTADLSEAQAQRDAYVLILTNLR